MISNMHGVVKNTWLNARDVEVAVCRNVLRPTRKSGDLDYFTDWILFEVMREMRECVKTSTQS